MLGWTALEEVCRSPGPNLSWLSDCREAHQFALFGRPTKAFYQLYIMGLANPTAITKSVQMIALDTSDGIILWDALNTPQDGPDVIEPSMRELGLDPARIKYIVLTHFHGDHVGCSKYLAEKYHARVLAADAEWNLMRRQNRFQYWIGFAMAMASPDAKEGTKAFSEKRKAAF